MADLLTLNSLIKPAHFTSSLGFSLLEMLVSLVLLSFLALGVAHYQVMNKSVQIRMQQETLAASALDSLLINAKLANPNSSNFSTININSLTTNKNCQITNAAKTYNWCLATTRLPQLEIKTTTNSIRLEWQAPLGKARVIRSR